jgi:hypothetical protein
MDDFVTGVADSNGARLATGEMWVIDDDTHTASFVGRLHDFSISAVYLIRYRMARMRCR